MLSFPAFFLPSLFYLFLSFTATADSPAFTPTDLILLNCGDSSNNARSPDGRTWNPDVHSKFLPSNDQKTSFALRASNQNPSVTLVPYMTARVSASHFTYIFPVTPGPKFLRLYFYPSTYPGFNGTTSFFSVSANSYTLLHNFSAYLTVSSMSPPVSSFSREFIVTVWDNEMLNVTFTPSLPSSFAFVNGIEVVSMPTNLYTASRDGTTVPFVSNNVNPLFYFENTTALETAYRLNVGGQEISSTEDTGMYRTWSQDLDYIFAQSFGTTPARANVSIRYDKDTPPYTAPAAVYSTSRTMGSNPQINMKYNLTWIFPIDGGFNYLVRLHFCETQLEVTRENQRVFSIFIDNRTAAKDADVIHWSGGTGIPIYRDYVVWVPSNSQSKQDLWLALHPLIDVKPDFADAILNGLEMFKLNNSDGSLAGPNPEPEAGLTSPGPYARGPERAKAKGSSTIKVITLAVLGCTLGLALVVSVIFFALSRNRLQKCSGQSDWKSSWVPISSYTATSVHSNTSSLPSDIFRRFSVSEIQAVTSNFDEKFLIGSGGFGNVYKGFIDGGSTAVAIKRLDPSSKQGAHEFQTELQMLAKLRHLHLVSLIGYCDDEHEMILVYEYMARGTLRDHLYNTKNPPLSWEQRLNICVGAAQGLHYLHTGAKHPIIHRDVKSTNILLDENWVAKVSDFGLSRVGPTSRSQTHVSTVVKGSLGYLDPEYYRRQQLTEKSDVYSFGVVLFEVLCGRPSIVPGLPKEQVSLAQWARSCHARGTLDQIMDRHLTADMAPVCLKKYGELAYSCMHDNGMERPTMNDVVWGLEFVLQLQRTAQKAIDGRNQIYLDEIEIQASPRPPREEVSTTDEDDLPSH